MNIYDFFKKKNSSSFAKDRLKLVLISDRTNCSPEIMEMIKADIIAVLSKYAEVEMDGLDIKIAQTDAVDGVRGVPAIFANIPIKEMKKNRQ